MHTLLSLAGIGLAIFAVGAAVSWAFGGKSALDRFDRGFDKVVLTIIRLGVIVFVAGLGWAILTMK